MATLDPCTSEQAQSVHIDAKPIVMEEQGPTSSSIGLIRRRVVRACLTTAKSYENEIQRCEVRCSSRFIRAIERRGEKKIKEIGMTKKQGKEMKLDIARARRFEGRLE